MHVDDTSRGRDITTTAPSYRPFCSRRCADVDLGRWLTGGYAIPSTDPADAEEAAAEVERAAGRRDRPN